MSVGIWWDRLVQDLRYGLRGLRRSPAFASAAVLSLALGIGANTAIFSVINAALLRALPVPHAEQLVLITNPKFGDFSYPDYVALRDGARVFSDLIAASTPIPVNVGVGTDTDPAFAKIVSGNYFAGLGIPSAIGRMFTRADEIERVAVLSHGYWMGRFGGLSTVLGQQIRLDGVPLVVVGVAPAGFFGEAAGESPDIWATVALQPPASRNERGFTWLTPIGRLRPGASLQQAQTDLDAVVTQLAPTGTQKQTAGENVITRIVVSPGVRGVTRVGSNFSAPLVVLMVIVGLVLLIACMNLGSLLLARGAARQTEIATRLAIGAGRARIVRQLMTESLLLATAGGALGLAFAVWGSHALIAMVSRAIPFQLALDVGIDHRMLLFTAIVSMGAGVLFGLTPALRAVRGRDGRDASSLLDIGRGVVVGGERRWSIRDAFIIAQIALSLMLLAGSALFIRTLRNLEVQDLGFPVVDRLHVRVMSERGYRPVAATLVPALLARVNAIPGVDAASVAFNGTLAESGSGVYGLEVEGYTPRDAQDQRARADWIGPDYFRTVRIPLLAGREFTLADTATAPKVAIVNETMARHYFNDSGFKDGGFQDGAALGRHIRFNKDDYVIVGVARDAKYSDLRAAVPRVIYFSAMQTGPGLGNLEIRTSTHDPLAIAAAVRSAIREVDPRLIAGEVMTLSERLDRKLSVEQLIASLASFFSGLTLLLVSVGIYGTLAYAAARRTKEIGVRLALGSDRGAVVWTMMRDLVLRLGVGVALGLVGVLATGGLIGSMLFGLQPNDAPTIAIATLLLTLIALLAGCVPTVRASRLDPASVLRE